MAYNFLVIYYKIIIHTIIKNIKTIALSLAIGVLLAGGATYAAAIWHGTDWIIGGAVVRADYMQDNFDYLYDRINDLQDQIDNIEINGGDSSSANCSTQMVCTLDGDVESRQYRVFGHNGQTKPMCPSGEFLNGCYKRGVVGGKIGAEPVTCDRFNTSSPGTDTGAYYVYPFPNCCRYETVCE